MRLYKTLIRPLLCQWSVILALTVMREHMPFVFKKTILRRIYGQTQEKSYWGVPFGIAKFIVSSNIWISRMALKLEENDGWGTSWEGRIEDNKKFLNRKFHNMRSVRRTKNSTLSRGILLVLGIGVWRRQDGDRKNGGVLWGTLGSNRGCNAIHEWMIFNSFNIYKIIVLNYILEFRKSMLDTFAIFSHICLISSQ